MSNEKVLLRLKTARGQIDAVIKMIEDERYCIDISNQLLAIQSLIKNEHDADKKIDEVIKLLTKL